MTHQDLARKLEKVASDVTTHLATTEEDLIYDYHNIAPLMQEAAKALRTPAEAYLDCVTEERRDKVVDTVELTCYVQKRFGVDWQRAFDLITQILDE